MRLTNFNVLSLMDKQSPVNLKLIKKDLKLLRLGLVFFTLIKIVDFSIWSVGYSNDILDSMLSVISILFHLIFIIFIWVKKPMDIYSKIRETILISFFGIFAMWIWIQFDDSIEKLKTSLKPLSQ